MGKGKRTGQMPETEEVSFSEDIFDISHLDERGLAISCPETFVNTNDCL